ncbi:MAG: cell surface protein SprA [Chitinispirillaceae bacterium]|nr:cell surface protein SprA [Chitinispirillaceae bacterium]
MLHRLSGAWSILLVMICSLGASGQGLRYERPVITGFHPLDDGTRKGSQLNAGHPVLCTLSTKLFRDTTVIDFEKRQITFVRYDSLGFILWNYHYDELNNYMADRRNFALNNTWYKHSLLFKEGTDQGTSESLKLAWELPVQYPGWAQRVLGNDPPRLTINGNMRITIGFEDMSRKDPGVQETQRGGAGFLFDQSNQFTITGSVGRLININISANSEGDVDMNNPLKNFKIEYKEQTPGELEDEIVQEVIAGYTGFSMPGTQLSGYSESKEGLFGIKVASRFGPLLLTTIASSEQGESQKLKVSNAGKGDASSTNVQQENGYIRNRYFFLDTAYITAYNRKYALNGGNLNAPPPPEVASCEVWLQIEDNEQERYVNAYGLDNVRQMYIDSSLRESRLFRKLLNERHYRLYPKEGYIRLFTDSVTIRERDILGIIMQTSGSIPDKGGERDTNRYVWVVKPKNPIDKLSDDPERFRLMWRNVYPLSGDIKDITKFQIAINHLPKDGQEAVKTLGDRYISEILGLTNKNGDPLIDRQYIFDFTNRELIIPPYDTTSFGNEPFANPALIDPEQGDLRDTMIYRFGPQSKEITSDFQPIFSIETSGSSKQTTFDLGFGIMENTVRVKADGALLQPNIDYILSPEIGSLELISPKALAAQNIEIDYQREALFMPERKVFLGSRAEMKLPFVSDNSLMGFSVLWQSSEVSQRIPRINQEPYSKLLFDFNTKFDLKPEWMTDIVNKIPLVKTDAASSANLEFEVAHSRMNPNSSDEAYVDDFESSKQLYPLGESYGGWHRASPPYHRDSLSSYPPAWDYYWFTPVWSDKRNRIPRDSVWTRDPKDDPIYTGMDQYESVLRLHVKPGPNDPTLQERYKKTWAGIMQSIPPGMSDRKRDQYFELLLKTRNNGIGNGKLRVQIGKLREDVCIAGAPPNGRPDKEDTARFWREYNVQELDKGLDTLWDGDEAYWVPDGNGGWLQLPKDDPLLEEFKDDPSKDNYRLYDDDHEGNYKYACRLENNAISSNSEDIDNNGTIETSLNEEYHEFIIDLADANSPFIDKSTSDKLKTSNGWRRYRFQLRDPYGDYPGVRIDSGLAIDEWTDIRMVRLIWEGFDTTALAVEDSLILSGMQFVGNQWEAVRDSSGRSNMDVSVIGTRESQEYKDSIKGYEDSFIRREENETGGYQHEQSLRLVFSDLEAGRTAIAEKGFAQQPLKVASYDNLTLIVHGKAPQGANPLAPLYNGDVRFVFRFGTDSITYYQYRRHIMPGWNNYIVINLKELSNLKLDWLTMHPDDSINAWSSDSTLHIRAPKGRQPNFANITWMAVGVECDPNASGQTPYSGELWVNELKVAGIKKFNGWSSRLNLQTQFADFLSVTGGLNFEGGDFKTMTDADITRTGDSKLSGNFSVSTGLDKFMPKEWGVSLPIGGSMTSSLTRPQLKPNSDIYLTDDNNKPDGLAEMTGDVINSIAGKELLDSDTTLAEHFETQSYGHSFFINYSKNAANPNPAVDLLLDRVSTDFRYNMNTNTVRRGQLPDQSGDYTNYDSSRTYTGGIKYDLTPKDPPAWTKWKPFGEKPAEWVPRQLHNLEFSLLPGRANLDLANATYSKSLERRFEPGINTRKESQVLDINHGFQLDFSPIRPLLDLSYSLAIRRNFPNASTLGGTDKTGEFLRDNVLKRHSDGTWHDYYILERERSRSQKLKLSLSPQFADWLTNSADYSADYDGSLSKFGNDSTTEYINSKVNTEVSFNSSLNISSLLPATPDSGKTGVLGRLRKGCDAVGFNNVNFTYSNNAHLTNNYLGSSFLSSQYGDKRPVTSGDFLAYQLGLQGRNFSDIVYGDMDDETAVGGMQYRSSYDDYNFYKDDNRSVTQSYQLSTSLGIAKPIDLRLSSISLRWNRTFNVKPDTARFDTSRTFPEISVGAHSSVLDKIKLLTRYLQGMGLSSNLSFRRSTRHNDAAGKERGRAFDLSPLVQFSGTLKKWPVRFNYQHTLGREQRDLERNDGSSGDGSTTNRDGDNIDMSYEIQQSSSLSTIKLLRWTVPVKGRTSMGMRFVRDHSVTTTAGEKTADNSNLSLTPHLKYVVTNNVTGTLEYTGSRITENGSITTSNKLALITEIRF